MVFSHLMYVVLHTELNRIKHFIQISSGQTPLLDIGALFIKLFNFSYMPSSKSRFHHLSQHPKLLHYIFPSYRQ